MIRSQVSEGLTMASAAKASVSEFYANRGDWPSGNSAAGLGNAIDDQRQVRRPASLSMTAASRSTYGDEVNTKIAGSTIGLTPGASVNGDVIWKCGNADDPSGWRQPTRCCCDDQPREQVHAVVLPSGN